MEYPKTCTELEQMITAQWPKVIESTHALECLRTDTFDIVEDVEFKPDIIETIWIQHIQVTHGGVLPYGVKSMPMQLFFTEEECVRAMWFYYSTLTPAKDFETDNEGVVFVWRIKPEVAQYHGCFRGYMRYGAVYKLRSGGYAGVHNLVTQK